MTQIPQKVGKYEIIRPLGTGGEGSVYLARDSVLSRLAAVKRLEGGKAWKGEQTGKGEQAGEGAAQGATGSLEADFLRDLHHPMLPVIYDLLYEDGCYLIMEYIEGISLHNYIEKTGGTGEERGYLWAMALLEILEYLHTRKPPVIYRDLKPQNIIVCPDKNLRLVDLGGACLKSYGEGMDKRMAVSPGYGAPEQQAGTGGCVYADERSDIFAFGRVLFYILTGADPGQPPYGSLPVGVYDPLLGEGFNRVIRKCTREEPGQRYQVVEEIRRDLSGISRNGKSYGRRSFLKHVEKRVWLTEKKMTGL